MNGSLQGVTNLKFVLLTAAFFTSSAFASTFSVEVGQTKMMGVSQRVASINVKDPSVVEVKKLPGGNGVSLVGKEMGKTKVSLRTVDGTEVDFTLHVTSAGARVFATSRDQDVDTSSEKSAKPADTEKSKARPTVADADAVPKA
jgi:Flp pilus assembly secretin CpaC